MRRVIERDWGAKTWIRVKRLGKGIIAQGNMMKNVSDVKNKNQTNTRPNK